MTNFPLSVVGAMNSSLSITGPFAGSPASHSSLLQSIIMSLFNALPQSSEGEHGFHDLLSTPRQDPDGLPCPPLSTPLIADAPAVQGCAPLHPACSVLSSLPPLLMLLRRFCFSICSLPFWVISAYPPHPSLVATAPVTPSCAAELPCLSLYSMAGIT